MSAPTARTSTMRGRIAASSRSRAGSAKSPCAASPSSIGARYSTISSTTPAREERAVQLGAGLDGDLVEAALGEQPRRPPRGRSCRRRPERRRLPRRAPRAPRGARDPRSTVSTSGGSPERILAVAGRSRRLSMTTRRGWREHGTCRTVSSGSSRRTVPMPVSMAHERARSAWTSRRAASPVIHRLSPLASAIRPSSEAADLMRIHGRPRDMRARNPRWASRASAARSPVSTRMPAARSLARPRPFTSGLGSSSAATTRATFAATSASAHGGVRP